MNSQKWFRQKMLLWLAAQVVATTLLLGTATVFAGDESANQAVAAEETAARKLLLKTSDFLARLPGFGVTMRSSYDSIQPDGQRIEFGEIRKILLQRPDRLRVEVMRSDGDQDLLHYNGQALTAYKAADNVFARVDFPGTVDTAIVYLVRDLQIHFPLARLLLTTLPEQLKGQIESISYVEENLLYDKPVDQLAARMKEVDVQLWIDQGDQPLPRRVVITYKNDPGQPQFRADFLDWEISPQTSEADFTLTPPTDAEEILFLAPVKPGLPGTGEKGGKS